MKRKGVKPQQPEAKTAKGEAATTFSLLPMEVQFGDRFTDQAFEWEVLTRPAALHGGRACARAYDASDCQRRSAR